MRKTKKAVLWVAYQMTPHGKQHTVNAVCEQSEWDAMELCQPGLHTLIRGHMENENEAELLARGTTGDPVKRTPKPRPAVAVSAKAAAC